MIARLWTARTTAENADAYARHLESRVIPQLRAIDGYRGAKLLRRAVGGEVELQVVTFWQSLAAIDAFAGADRDAAVVAGEAAALLTSFDTRVRHFDIALVDGAP